MTKLYGSLNKRVYDGKSNAEVSIMKHADNQQLAKAVMKTLAFKLVNA
jgi:hypothetical protein